VDGRVARTSGAAVTAVPREGGPDNRGVPPPTHTPLKVGGRLFSYAVAWTDFGASFWQTRVVRRGLAWSFTQKPILSCKPLQFSIHQPSRAKLMLKHIGVMLLKGAIEHVPNPLSPGFYSLIFLRPKKNGELRPIIDLSRLNVSILCPTFKMETAQSIRAVLAKGQWVASIDMQDAYFHLPIRRSFRKYLRFALKGQAWQFCACPFGLSVAPWAFTGLISLVAKICHGEGIQIHLYLDDWLLRGPSKEVLTGHVTFVTNLMQKLGLLINWEKSELIPTQTLTFLSYAYNLRDGTVRPTEENVTKVVTKAGKLLRDRRGTAREWLSLIGIVNAIAPVSPLGRLLVCPLDIHAHQQWIWRADDPRTMQAVITVPDPLCHILEWWKTPHWWNLGVTLQPFRADHHLYTDPSYYGWGSHMGLLTASGTWTPQEALNHINVLECETVLRALQHFGKLVVNGSVLVSTDNTTTLSYINKQGGTKSIEMLHTTRTLLLWCHANGISLRAVHIKGSLNGMADLLSRDQGTVNTEWSLHPSVVQELWERAFRPDVDLFATQSNRKLPLYVSPFPDAKAWGMDAMSLNWDDLSAYAFPPFALVPSVVKKLEQSHSCRMVLITPHWPSRSWFATLQNLSEEAPWPLPMWPNLLKQPTQNLFHENLPLLNLHAWFLSSSS
jgi:hypothetical protein